MNIFITKQVQTDALAINIAGRQRMLSQRIAKVLLLIAYDNISPLENQIELSYVSTVFSSTLTALAIGGNVVDGEGKSAYLPGLKDAIALRYVTETQVLSDEIDFYIQQVLVDPNNGLALNEALRVSKRNNLKILDLMNALTFRIEEMAAEKTMVLRWIQTFAFILALLNFVIIVRLFYKRSKESDTVMKSVIHLVNSAAACLVVFDENGKVQFANKMSLNKFGYQEDEFLKLTDEDLFKTEHNETYAMSAESELIQVELIERRFVLNSKELLIVTINDISHHAEVRERLAYLANHDLLTELCNRRGFLDKLACEVARAERNEDRLGLFFIDLDKFKPVNDLLGHEVGDFLLKLFASRLRKSFRKSDIVARYGGDEFVVLITDVRETAAFARCAALIKSIFYKPFVWENEEIFLDCSIGMSKYPEDSMSVHGLLSLADQRMYESKKSKNAK